MSGDEQLDQASAQDAEETPEPASDEGEPEPATEALRQLLRVRTDDLTHQVVGGSEAPTVPEIEQVENLARLLAIREDLDQKGLSQRKLWVAAGGLLVLAGIVSLLFWPKTSTEVALDATAFEVGFELTRLQELTDGLSPVVVGLTGLSEARLPRANGRAAETVELSGAGALRLHAGGEATGTMTLAPLVLPAGSRCRLLPSNDPRRLRLALESDALELGLDVHGVVQLDIPGRDDIELEVASPRRIDLLAAGRELELDLRFAAPPRRVFPPRLEIAALDLARVDEIVTPERTLLRHTSTLAGGTLYFESLDGRERTLRLGEMLRFEDARGFLSSLDVAESPPRLAFRGRVQGMTTGDGRSLMPSHLEYLRQRRGLELLWGAVFSLLVLAEAFFLVWNRL